MRKHRRKRGLAIINSKERDLGIQGPKNRYSVILKENDECYLVTIITSLEDKNGTDNPNKIRKVDNKLLLEIDKVAPNLQRRSAISIRIHFIKKTRVRFTIKRTNLQDKLFIYKHVFSNPEHYHLSKQNRSKGRKFDRQKVKQKV